jgi:tRNA threonylcarbamoyl adenosine modification protein (Sua5/YciO/YrdC/YwlC family)
VDRVELDPWLPRPDRVLELVRHLQRGRLVAFPTDTSWAVACDPMQSAATARLTELRARMSGKDARSLRERPMSLLCGDLSVAGRFVTMDQPQFRVVRRLLPGPYTIILPASREVPRQLQTRRNEVGIRMPDTPICMALLRAFDGPLLGTTARTRDGSLLTSSAEIDILGRGAVDVVVETDPIVPEPSTVLDLTTGVVRVLRSGAGPVDRDWIVEESS